VLWSNSNLDKHVFTLDGLVGFKFDNLENVNQFVELLGDLLEGRISNVNDKCDAREPSTSVVADGEEWMLYPRRANSPATRVSGPGLSSTRSDRTWCVMAYSSSQLGAWSPGILNVRVSHALWNHRPDHRFTRHNEVDDDGAVIRLERKF